MQVKHFTAGPCSIRTESGSTFSGFHCVYAGFQHLIFSRACLRPEVCFSLFSPAAAALYGCASRWEALVVRHLLQLSAVTHPVFNNLQRQHVLNICVLQSLQQ